MSKQQGKLQKSVEEILLVYSVLSQRNADKLKLAFGALIGVDVIILQAFIASGASDGFALASVIFLAIAIPFLGLYLYIVSIEQIFKKTHVPKLFFLVYYIGILGSFFGITSAFFHISSIAGIVFFISFTICVQIRSSFEMPRYGIDD